MNKKTSKILALFWLLSGLIWLAAFIRHVIVRDDMVGAIIYIVASAVSFVLCLAYYKNFNS